MIETPHAKRTNATKITALLFAFVLVLSLPVSVQAGPNDGVTGLNDEQAAFASRLFTFMSDMDAKYFGRAGEIDGDLTQESQDFDYDFARYEVKVARGPVVEKIGRMTGIIFETTSEIQFETVFGRYYGIDVHAKNPKVGLLHAAFLMQYYPDGTSALGGTLNIVPGAAPEEDLATIKAALDAVFAKHGVDPAPHRKRVCEGTEMAVDSKYRRRLACVGGSFFGPKMMSVTEENFLFMTEAYDSFIGAYMTTLARHTNDPSTDEEIATQDAMRLNWFEDQMFTDPYAASGITPYEVWSLAFTPPVVKF